MNGCMWCYSIFHSATKPCNDSPIIYAGSSKDPNKTKYGKNEKVLICRDYAIACSSLCDSVNSVFSMFNPSYDADGNMTSVQTSTGTWTIEYNAENRPVRWTNAATGTVITMTFDSQGRRTEYKSVTNGAQNTWLRFLYDGYLCVQVLYSNEPYNVFKEFVWDPTEPVATRPLVFRYAPNSLNLFYAFDGNKNVSDVFYRMTSNGIGAHYDYAPFGATTRTHRDSSASFDIVTLNPFRFSSEHYDSELDLVYYNYRHYSPSFGRFLSRDPIEEQGGLNLYAFVGNCPFISEITGLISTQDLWELISSPKLNKYYPLRRQAFEVGDFAVSVYGGIKQVCCDKAGMANKGKKAFLVTLHPTISYEKKISLRDYLLEKSPYTAPIAKILQATGWDPVDFGVVIAGSFDGYINWDGCHERFDSVSGSAMMEAKPYGKIELYSKDYSLFANAVGGVKSNLKLVARESSAVLEITGGLSTDIRLSYRSPSTGNEWKHRRFTWEGPTWKSKEYTIYSK